MKIAVLAGGLSSERDVSILSGSKIAEALRSKGHHVVLIDVYMGYEGADFDADRLFAENYDFTDNAVIGTQAPDIDAVKKSRQNQSDCFFGDHVIELCRAADVTFLGLHGGAGEDGSVQAALQLHGIKYTGSDHFGSALAMDKGVSKGIFIQCGVPTPKSRLFKNGEDTGVWDHFPCVVKPCSGGSSVGVSMAQNRGEYDQAVQVAFELGTDALVEEYVRGREFSIGVLGGRALPIIEIIPKDGWYDYKNKYQAGATVEVCPAELSEEITQKMQREAEHVFEVLKLGAYARVDFLLDQDNHFYCLEANTLPGMTPMSLLPQEAAAAGIGYPDLCEKIIELSLSK